MKDISVKKRNLAKFYAKKYDKDVHDPVIDTLAEVQAIMRNTIPDPYWGYSIKQLNGKAVEGDSKMTLLSADAVIKVRDQISEYCWKDADVVGDNDNSLLDKSIMSSRLREGKNVVIYAPNDADVNNAPNKLVAHRMGHLRNQKGRTMVASLILKEAIRLRFKSGNRAQSYDWIEYPVLKNALIESKSSMNLQKSCDWLVVDDISLEHTPNAMQYMSGVIDPFFISRLRNGLPTIFVFRFDIKNEDNFLNIEKGLGTAIHRIVNDPKTHVISLGE